MAALELFSVKGYEGTSVEEIAKYVGIKAPTMYKHLKSKEELLQILVDKSEDDHDNGIKQNLQGTDEISSGDDLKDYAMRLSNKRCTSFIFYQYITNSQGNQYLIS